MSIDRFVPELLGSSARTTAFVWIAATGVVSAAPAPQLTFTDRASEAGVRNVSFGRGSAMLDLDGDGLLDLIAGDAGTPTNFYRQLPDHTFQLANAAWGIADTDAESWGILAADFDNDGDADVYEVNGGLSGPESNRMLRNDIATTGTFTDISSQTGAAELPAKNFGGTAADYDNDGDLDLFLTDVSAACYLLRNDGDFAFFDVSTAAGITHAGKWRHCGQGDYDRDGWIDFFVGNRSGTSIVYRNLGDGTFEEVAAQVGIDEPQSSFGAVLTDFDHDGWLDLYLPQYLRQPQGNTSKLYLNNRDGTFRDVSAGAGVTGQTDMGHNVGDLDADGCPDVYIGTGRPGAEELDILWRVFPDGSGGLSTEDLSDSSGITSGGPTRCHGMAIGDYDGDGDLDIYVNNGGPSQDSGMLEENFLWTNEGNDNGWVGIELDGVLSNRDGVGAHTIAITPSGREIHRERDLGRGFCNTNSPVLHFGLGAEQTAEWIQIHWPSGIEQICYAPIPSSVQRIRETGLRIQAPLQIGTQVELEITGPANHDVRLFAGTTTTWQPLPALHGVWQLADPTPLLTTRTDERGLVVESLDIPDDPALIGATFHLQAWLHDGSSQSLTSSLPVVIEP